MFRRGGAIVAVVALLVVFTACSQAGQQAATGGPTTAAGAGGTVTGTAGPTVQVATTWSATAPGVQHLSFSYGPIAINPGQNNIDISKGQVPKPEVDGYVVSIRPDLKRKDGSVPPVDVIHLHHGVWLTTAGKDATAPGLPERFFAAGEEKTYMQLPQGYGYPYKASDVWTINYMLHNLLPTPDEVSITYDMDFVPADSPAAAGIKPARPIWMDVENGRTYPVFDVLKGSGANNTFTYPDDQPDAYKNRPAPGGTGRRRNGGTTTTTAPSTQPPTRVNEWRVDRDGILLGTAAHLHPGGLHGDMYLQRPGATAPPGSDAAAAVVGDTAHIFRSEAVYYEPAGAVSWDVSMTVTPPDWRVKVKAGDVLRINATYDSARASWYESMGIMIAWMADEGDGTDPFSARVDHLPGQVTHGHLKENDNHGGEPDRNYADLTQAPASQPTDKVTIGDFVYTPGDMLNSRTVPVVKQGGTLTFTNADDTTQPTGLWHTITACKAPCNRSTGIAYPLADADVQFDSGELGTGGPPTANRVDWQLPTSIPPGSYTYFCRIHPFMRGGFRVEPGDGTSTPGTGG